MSNAQNRANEPKPDEAAKPKSDIMAQDAAEAHFRRTGDVPPGYTFDPYNTPSLYPTKAD